VTPRDGNDVDVLVLLEQRLGVERLLERRLGEVDLVGDAAAVDLDLHHVRLLLLQARLADLRVGKHAHDGAVLADALELARDARAVVGRVLLRVLGEGLLLAAVPVLVEAALDLVGQVLGPHGGERAQAARRLDVADDTDDDHRRRLDDRDGLDDLTLVHLRAGAVEVAHDVRHAGLVAHHGREVDRLLGVVLGEPAAGRASALRLCGSSVCGWRSCRYVFIGVPLCACPVAFSPQPARHIPQLRLVHLPVSRISLSLLPPLPLSPRRNTHDFTFPRWRAARLRGRKPVWPSVGQRNG
jgi:hypothetical protein